MKKIFSIIVMMAFLAIFSGCDKLLDLEPSQSIDENEALTTDTKVKSVLKGAYFQMADDGLYGGCLLRNSELLAGDGELFWVGTYGGPRQIFNKAMNAANEDVRIQWLDAYLVVNSANNVLSALDIVLAEDRDRVEGEALFLRSYAYFDLVRYYGSQYVPASTNNQFGVPLILTPTKGGVSEANYVGRATVQAVYDKVVADLIKAASLLPEDNDVYASSGAANALLARVYLQQGEYAKARDAANTVISADFYQLLPAYSAVFNNDNNSSEDIFAIQITPQDRFSAMTEFFSVPDYGGRDGDIVIEEGHLNLYDFEDERLALFFIYDGYMSGKWNNQYGVVNLIRLAEMYLIRAECNFRLNTSIGATPLADYNTIHTRAGLNAATTVTLDDILLERRLELSCEGFMIHDIRRLNGTVGTIPYNDPSLLFPIPARELEANPILKTQQNPGY
jgi:starch-binding outer membrane protein, SusD/RagB family